MPIWNEKFETMSRAELEQEQLERLQQTLGRVYRRVSHYHELFNKIGFDPLEVLISQAQKRNLSVEAATSVFAGGEHYELLRERPELKALTRDGSDVIASGGNLIVNPKHPKLMAAKCATWCRKSLTLLRKARQPFILR